eukprot:10733571-Prorocentrum_lima.AAC.1
MTSSLVGSEMCIRDRVPTTPLTAAPAADPGQPPPLNTLWFFNKPMPQAVSYTHLTLPTICSV